MASGIYDETNRPQEFCKFIQGHTISEGRTDMQIQVFIQWWFYLNHDNMTIQFSDLNVHTNQWGLVNMQILVWFSDLRCHVSHRLWSCLVHNGKSCIKQMCLRWWVLAIYRVWARGSGSTYVNIYRWKVEDNKENSRAFANANGRDGGEPWKIYLRNITLMQDIPWNFKKKKKEKLACHFEKRQKATMTLV